jgi:hypothetical protein
MGLKLGEFSRCVVKRAPRQSTINCPERYVILAQHEHGFGILDDQLITGVGSSAIIKRLAA